MTARLLSVVVIGTIMSGSTAIAAEAQVEATALKSMVVKGFSDSPATFNEVQRGSNIVIELCFDSCYEFISAGPASEPLHWRALVLFMSSVGRWNLPDKAKEDFDVEAKRIVKTSADCTRASDRAGCALLRLAQKTSTQIYALTNDEGNACRNRVLIEESVRATRPVLDKKTTCQRR